MEYNAKEDIKLSKLCTKSVLAKIEDTKESIKKVEAVIKERTKELVHFNGIAEEAGNELQITRDTTGTDNIRLEGIGESDQFIKFSYSLIFEIASLKRSWKRF